MNSFPEASPADLCRQNDLLNLIEQVESVSNGSLVDIAEMTEVSRLKVMSIALHNLCSSNKSAAAIQGEIDTYGSLLMEMISGQEHSSVPRLYMNELQKGESYVLRQNLCIRLGQAIVHIPENTTITILSFVGSELHFRTTALGELSVSREIFNPTDGLFLEWVRKT